MKISEKNTMDFKTSESYMKLEITKDDNGYDVFVLPAGSTVYRGDPVKYDGNMKPKPFEGPSKDVPIFFGDRDLAERYSSQGTISSYKTTKDGTLFVMSESNFVKLAAAQTNAEDKNFIEKYYILPKLGEEGAKTLAEFNGMGMNINKDTTAIQPYETITRSYKYPLYSNRKLAQLVCAAGFAGWIVFPMTLIQKIRRQVGLYDPEIVLCQWAVTADRISGGDYRMPRKYNRKYCKKTRCKKMGFSQKASCRPYKNCFTRRKARSA